MAIFRKGPGPYALSISMSGVKMGDRLLQIGSGDGRLFAALAGKVGLTGRACIVDEIPAAADRALKAAADAGVLIESEVARLESLPYDGGSFDLVVIQDALKTMEPEKRVGCLQEVHRVLRGGGRCVIIEAMTRGGLGTLLGGRNRHYPTSGGAERALEAEGFRSVRRLAEREGLAFIEGFKPATGG